MLTTVLKPFVLLAAAFFFVPAALAGTPPDGRPPTVRPVVVELFTSQGCGDCPEADRIAADLAKRKDAIVLTLPITYWDVLGWKDTFATGQNTKRQNAYAKTMNRAGVYTPQMVMDGIEDVVGNRRDLVMSALAGRMRMQPRSHAADLHVALLPGRLTIGIGAAKAKERPSATIWVMRTLLRGIADVRHGANSNRMLTYVNVVRELHRAGEWTGEAMTIDFPMAQSLSRADGIAVIVQSREHGEVLNAASLTVPASTLATNPY
jgi:hypothetical protein